VATSFRMPFQVLKRNIGQWVNGVYKIDDETGTFITVMATVQMPSTGDMMKIETSQFGRRAGRYIKIYTDTRLNCVAQEIDGLREANAGDIFFYDDSQYLIFGESDFTMLSRNRATPVSHWRYYACEAIEAFVTEQAP
jgi:hypothetical protein